jgi:hypothetical protein
MGSFDARLTVAIHEALEELSRKTLLQIQTETAITWTGRAIAAYQIYMQTRSLEDLMAAEEFAHEGLEHAALAGPHVYMEMLECLHAAKVAVSAVPPTSA